MYDLHASTSDARCKRRKQSRTGTIRNLQPGVTQCVALVRNWLPDKIESNRIAENRRISSFVVTAIQVEQTLLALHTMEKVVTELNG